MTINCPFCKQQLFMIQDKRIILETDVKQECPKCKKVFLYRYSRIVTKPGCLNREKRPKHVWQPSFNVKKCSYDSKVCIHCRLSKKNTHRQIKFLNTKNRRFIEFIKQGRDR